MEYFEYIKTHVLSVSFQVYNLQVVFAGWGGNRGLLLPQGRRLECWGCKSSNWDPYSIIGGGKRLVRDLTKFDMIWAGVLFASTNSSILRILVYLVIYDSG